MRKYAITLLLPIFIFTALPQTTHAQATELAELAVDIQKLAQLKKILQNMYNAYTIVNQGYEKVKNVTSGNYSLHEAFLDGLLLVNPNIRKYKRVQDIITCQEYILSEYKSAFGAFKQSDLFTPKEIEYLASVYTNLFDQSLQNIDELTLVLTESDLRMSDDERITAIDRLFADMQTKLSFLRGFNRKTAAIMQQRRLSNESLQSIQQLYDITP